MTPFNGSSFQTGSALEDARKSKEVRIGEVFATNMPTVIQTLLGSCISVCLYDPKSRTGGMNHILLPGRADMGNFDKMARYGINAMELLINRMLNLGTTRYGLIAKVFGGAHIITEFDEHDSPGSRNLAFTMNFLSAERIPVLSCDVGGYNARRIFFHTDSGHVMLKRIKPTSLTGINRDERNHMRRVCGEIDRKGSVELFE